MSAGAVAVLIVFAIACGAVIGFYLGRACGLRAAYDRARGAA